VLWLWIFHTRKVIASSLQNCYSKEGLPTDAFDDNATATGIAYPKKALKKDLWDVIKESRTFPEYVIDKIAEEKGDF